jgi:hypothetical protein
LIGRINQDWILSNTWVRNSIQIIQSINPIFFTWVFNPKTRGKKMDTGNQGGGYPPIIINQPPAPAPAPAIAPAPVVVREESNGRYQMPWWGWGGAGGWGGGWGGGYGGYGRGGHGGYGHGGHFYDQKREEADRVRDTCNLGTNLRNDFTEQNLNKAVTDVGANSSLGHAAIGKNVSDAALNNALGQAELRGVISDGFSRATLAACESHADLRQQLADCCCETQKEIMRQGFATQQGFAGVDRTLCEQGSLTRENDNKNAQSILDAIAQSDKEKLRDQLNSCERQLSEARLPGDILQTFRNCGCCPPPDCNGGHHSRGGGGNGTEVNVEVINMVNQMNRQIAELAGQMRAMQSNGRNGPPGPP